MAKTQRGFLLLDLPSLDAAPPMARTSCHTGRGLPGPGPGPGPESSLTRSETLARAPRILARRMPKGSGEQRGEQTSTRVFGRIEPKHLLSYVEL